jgi:hypothetical protein
VSGSVGSTADDGNGSSCESDEEALVESPLNDRSLCAGVGVVDSPA